MRKDDDRVNRQLVNAMQLSEIVEHPLVEVSTKYALMLQMDNEK
jgi:hypothetical protein